MKKRWDYTAMANMGQKLFMSIYRKKRMAHANHDIHLLARTMSEWLPRGIQSIIDGTYTPRLLKRYYFKEEMLDQLHLSDRVLQHVILQQLKLTFPHIMNPNCYHLLIILCHTKRQLGRCKRRLMTILKERHLQLSRKKTRIGSIAGGFHFLGINYLETQASDSINVTQDILGLAANESFADNECLLVNQTGGGVRTI